MRRAMVISVRSWIIRESTGKSISRNCAKALSGKFEHRAMIDPLAGGKDILGGKHGNTQVPKMLGSLMRYVYTGDETDHKAATYFWDEVALHHSFATGGHGKNEYLSQPDKL